MIASWKWFAVVFPSVPWLLQGCGKESAAVAREPETSASCGAVDSTFIAIQRSIFEAHGCTSHSCHGHHQPQGQLELTAEVAYDNLVNVPAHAGLPQSMMRVLPGERSESLLYLKLAAHTLGEALPIGGGAPMPAGGALAVPAAKLRALSLWIHAGAPRSGVVQGTDALLACDLPEPNPQKAPPLEPPSHDVGYQLYGPGWNLPAEHEDEVCFATYYDLTDRAPDYARAPCPEGARGTEQTCVLYHGSLLVQDAQSHHSNIYAYLGNAPPSDPVWGHWACLGGAHDGTACDPQRFGVSAGAGGADCGPRAACTSEVRSSAACLGVGPDDFATARRAIGGAQGARWQLKVTDGVYGAMPIRGLVVWDSHAFNLTKEPTTVEQYLNMNYAAPSDQRYLLQRIFDDGDMFAMDVPPFQKQEICRTYTLERGARLRVLQGHMHKRGTLFRIWDAPNEPCTAHDAACVAPSRQPIYLNTEYDDPTALLYDPPRAFDQEEPSARTLLYCAVYDNGASDPQTVKRRSSSPTPPSIALGGPCAEAALACLGGDRQGMNCAGDPAICTGGGSCDACPLKGGLTTEDEMFILVGGYHVIE